MEPKHSLIKGLPCTYTIFRYFYLNKIKSIQTLSQNDKAILVKTAWQLKLLSFVLFSGLEGDF